MFVYMLNHGRGKAWVTQRRYCPSSIQGQPAHIKA